MTQEAFARAADVVVETVARIEQSVTRRVNGSTFELIASALEITPGALLERVEAYRAGGVRPTPVVAVMARPQSKPVRDQSLVRRLVGGAAVPVEDTAPLREQLRLAVSSYALQVGSDRAVRDAMGVARRYGQATGLLRLVERDVAETGDRHQSLLLQLAALSLLMGDTERAADALTRVLHIAPMDVDAMILQAQVDRIRGRFDAAARTYGQALRLVKDDAGRIAALSGRGLVARDQGELDQSKRYHEEALHLARQAGLRRAEADEHRYLASVSRRLGAKRMPPGEPASEESFREARRHYAAALRIYRSLGDRVGVANSLDNLGVFYVTIGKARMAERRFHGSLKINRRLRRRSGTAFAMGNLCMALGIQEKYAEAVRWAQAGIRIQRKMGQSEQVARAHGNIAECYTRWNRIGLARRHWREARDLFKEIGLKEQARACELNLEKLRGAKVDTPHVS